MSNSGNYIVFDLEWNQGDRPYVDKNKSLTFEIVEIGAVKLDKNKKKIDQFEQLIKPKIFKHMHKITGKLIHLSMEDLQDGKDFKTACKEFLDWCGEDPIFCTWGPSDLDELQKNMEFYGMTPLSDRPIGFYDVQKLYSYEFDDGKSRTSLETAVDSLMLDKTIPFHRAFADADYTGRIFAKIGQRALERISFDTYIVPKNKEQEIKITFEDYFKYISREFGTKEELLADDYVCSTQCFICNKNLKRRMKWFTTNGKHYYSVSYCEVHGLMKGKVRVKKDEDDKFYAVKTTRFITDKEYDALKKRKNKIKFGPFATVNKIPLAKNSKKKPRQT